MRKILVTGSAGFIGFHIAKRLLAEGDQVVGIDNVNDYYDLTLKRARLENLAGMKEFSFVRGDIGDRLLMSELFSATSFEIVVHMAAQAGVRYSVSNPAAYVDSNLVGFANILEGCRHSNVRHLVYASSSSVYGANTQMPFSTHHNVDHPISLYAATKKANELMAHTYSHLYHLPTTGLRFFTVYGPWGRPDMALFKFTKAILDGDPIEVYNNGAMRRDFTYIDDVTEGVIRVMGRIPTGDSSFDAANPDPATSTAPYRLYNIGNNRPVELMHLIRLLEQNLGRKAAIKFMPIQPGDVLATYANVDDLMNDVGFSPATPVEVGVAQFVEWYREFYRVEKRLPTAFGAAASAS